MQCMHTVCTYRGLIPEMAWFGEIVMSVLPPSAPATIVIVYDRSPVPTVGSEVKASIETLEVADTVRG